jgi:hypothetical protein
MVKNITAATRGHSASTTLPKNIGGPRRADYYSERGSTELK